jgi:hypothetical protein
MQVQQCSSITSSDETASNQHQISAAFSRSSTDSSAALNAANTVM